MFVTDVSLSLSVVCWKDISSEEKVERQEKLLAVVEVVANSPRRYLKLSRIQSPVSWRVHVVLDSSPVLRGPVEGASLDRGTFLSGGPGGERSLSGC